MRDGDSHSNAGPSAWADACAVAAVLTIDPGLGGAVLTARAGPVRDAWLALLRGLQDEARAFRRIPAGIHDEALLGGLDLAATLKSGRVIQQAGLLEEIGDGIGVLAMAERAETGLAGRLAARLDQDTPPTLIALDERAEEDEQVASILSERLAFHIDLNTVSLADMKSAQLELDEAVIAMAKMHWPYVVTGEAERAVTVTAMAMGIDTMRAPLLALRAARAHAALFGRDEIEAADTGFAARLILAPRATRLPVPEEEEPQPDTPDPSENDAPQDASNTDADDNSQALPEPDALTEITLEAAKAAIPDDLLARLKAEGLSARASGEGKAGALRKDALRGRPLGARRGDLGGGRRLDVLATLRAAAPWSKARRTGWERLRPGPGVEVRREDFRIKRFKQTSETETIFVVDASGSLALHRLAEAKGAVELMLAQSYVRRDQVAVIAFRGQGAQMLLPPTRSLTRAKKSLAALPGGGGTPLAAAIDAAEHAAHAATRHGRSPTLVFLTDGAANVTRAGHGGRELAQAEAREAARQVRAGGYAAIVVDVSKRGADAARSMAQDMGARYVRLPVADAHKLADLAREVAA